jgi:hypothetical protein
MKKFFLQLLMVGVLGSIISGCAANQVSLVDKNMVSVEKQGNKTVEILWTDVYQDGEDTVVWGAIQR